MNSIEAEAWGRANPGKILHMVGQGRETQLRCHEWSNNWQCLTAGAWATHYGPLAYIRAQWRLGKPTDCRLTPEWLLDPVRSGFGHIELDPCTEPNNPVGARVWETQDGLGLDWHSMVQSGVIWLNPPFSTRYEWDEKAVNEYRKGAQILVLSGVDYSTQWWQLLSQYAPYRCELKRRVKCLSPDDGREYDVARCCAVWALISLEHGPRLKAAFEHLGRIVRP